MSGMSRRALLQASAGAAALAAVPMSALSSGVASAGAARAATARDPDADTASGPALDAAHGEPVMFCVHDAARGEVSILHGADEVIVRDRRLVARIMQAAVAAFGLRRTAMSSHREAPEISKDPVADNTDTYAFVSPDRPDTVTIITNYIPLEDPAGGPNFFEFGDDVLYDDQHRQQRRRPARRHLPVPVHDDGRQPGQLPVQHRPDRRPRQPELQPAPDVHRHRGAQPPRAGRSAGTCRRRRATSGCARRRTTPALADVGDLRPRRRRSRSSPASASTASTSTSARSSTSPRCARSRTST